MWDWIAKFIVTEDGRKFVNEANDIASLTGISVLYSIKRKYFQLTTFNFDAQLPRSSYCYACLYHKNVTIDQHGQYDCNGHCLFVWRDINNHILPNCVSKGSLYNQLSILIHKQYYLEKIDFNVLAYYAKKIAELEVNEDV